MYPVPLISSFCLVISFIFTLGSNDKYYSSSYYPSIITDTKTSNEIGKPLPPNKSETFPSIFFSSYENKRLDSIQNEGVKRQSYESLRPQSHHRAVGPPVNAMYELEVKIPIIGQQRFQLKILSLYHAELIINGVLEVKDIIPYRVDPKDGGLSFTLSDNTKRILKKFRTTLVSASYCTKTDTPSIVVSPPLPTNINLNLRRKVGVWGLS